ncbi:hypothetical protein ACI7YQ_16800 [Alteromonas marina]
MSIIIPIGSWCRTAYQVNTFKASSKFVKVSYPFDWTITPFSALRSTLSPTFDIGKVLLSKSVEISKFGSVRDLYSDIIFHHDLEGKYVEEHKLDVSILEQTFEQHNIVRDTVGRLAHTMGNFKKLKEQSNLLFVRWQREGHPDSQLPNAFSGESIATITDILSNYLEHNLFKVLVVKSKIVDGDYEGAPYEIETHRLGANAIAFERRGFNGDGTNDFRGDERAWQPLLNEAYEKLIIGK